MGCDGFILCDPVQSFLTMSGAAGQLGCMMQHKHALTHIHKHTLRHRQVHTLTQTHNKCTHTGAHAHTHTHTQVFTVHITSVNDSSSIHFKERLKKCCEREHKQKSLLSVFTGNLVLSPRLVMDLPNSCLFKTSISSNSDRLFRSL